MLRSGQLALLTGVSPDLLRHYERIGILPTPVRALNGYRLYAPQMAAPKVGSAHSGHPARAAG